MTYRQSSLGRGDLAFLLEAHDIPGEQLESVSRRLARDPDYRRHLLDNEHVFQMALHDTEAVVEISPALLFEIMLYKVRTDLEQISATVSGADGLALPLLDAGEALDLLDDEQVLAYLVGMLTTFVQPEARSLQQRGKGAVVRKVRYADLDLPSLLRLAETASGTRRLTVYRRVADVCLFMLGVYPEFVASNHRYPSGGLRPLLGASFQRVSPEEYEARGRQFYKLAAEHRAARGRRLSDVLWTLHEGFSWALKPLNFLSSNYLYRQGVLLT